MAKRPRDDDFSAGGDGSTGSGRRPKEPRSGGAEARFECVKRSAVRDGFDQRRSQRTGFVEVGEVVDALECRTNEGGVRRVRFARGWLSVTSQKGDLLLKELRAAPAPVPAPAGTPGTPPPDGSAFVGCQLRSLAKAKIRAGSAMDSAAVGELAKGETLTVLELLWLDGRTEAAPRLLRVRHARGWSSVRTAGSGRELLQLVPASPGAAAARAAAKPAPAAGAGRGPEETAGGSASFVNGRWRVAIPLETAGGPGAESGAFVALSCSAKARVGCAELLGRAGTPPVPPPSQPAPARGDPISVFELEKPSGHPDGAAAETESKAASRLASSRGEIFGMPNAPNARNRGADGVEEVLPEKGARTHTPQEIAGMVLPGSGFHYAGHEVRSKTMRNIVCCCWWWCLFCLETC